MTQEELDAVVDEAHAFHKTCAVHCFTPQAQRMSLMAGADTIEHMVFSDDETIGMIKEKGAWVTPTLAHRTDHAIKLRQEQGTSKFVTDKMKKLQPYTCSTRSRRCTRRASTSPWAPTWASIRKWEPTRRSLKSTSTSA